MTLELKPIPSNTWQAQYNVLMQDKYLSKKYNRKRRIKDKRKFMGEMTPELKHCTDKIVLDIGPGMGEYLEICREFGHKVYGIDAEIDDCEMGNEYIKMSKLMIDRQKIAVKYIGFDRYLDGAPAYHFLDGSVFYIVMQGSIEQCFKDYMTGPPHRKTKKASGLKWKTDKPTWDIFYKMFEEFDRILVDGGYIVIWANGSKNNVEYDDMILRTAKKFPAFKLFKKIKKTFHKFRIMR